MKAKFRNKFKILLLMTLLSELIVWGLIKGDIEEGRQEIHIALACPVSGPEGEIGKSFIRGAKLFLQDLEDQDGIKGIKLILDIYDEQNDPALAALMAEDIANNPKIKAVVGHHFSSCSIKAGEVYKKYQLPAITPGSTHIDVTKENPYYLRTIFNDNLQSRFLANYMKKVLGNETVSIIQEDRAYVNEKPQNTALSGFVTRVSPLAATGIATPPGT